MFLKSNFGLRLLQRLDSSAIEEPAFIRTILYNQIIKITCLLLDMTLPSGRNLLLIRSMKKLENTKT